jgi:hypothetical protein
MTETLLLILYDKAYVTIVHLFVYYMNWNIPLLHRYVTYEVHYCPKHVGINNIWWSIFYCFAMFVYYTHLRERLTLKDSIATNRQQA